MNSVFFWQVYLPAEQFIVIFDNSSQIFMKQRPIDNLLQIISSLDPDFNQEFQRFLDFYGEVETCTMLFQIMVDVNDSSYYYFNKS